VTKLFIIMSGLGFIFFAGCGASKKEAPAAPATPPAATSAVDTVIDGMTGMTAVRGYQHAKDVIDRVNKQQSDENTNEF
jgi:hypothetical protein